MRDALGIQPGDEVVFALERQGVYIQLARAASSPRGSFTGVELVRELEADRQAQ